MHVTERLLSSQCDNDLSLIEVVEEIQMCVQIAMIHNVSYSFVSEFNQHQQKIIEKDITVRKCYRSSTIIALIMFYNTAQIDMLTSRHLLSI